MKLTRQALGLIYDSCSGSCYYCGTKIPPFSNWEVDHMTPRQQGGEDAFHNLVVACRPCNRSKGNRTVEEFRQAIVRRALNAAASALATLSPYVIEPDTDYQKAVEALRVAEKAIATADIIFYGESSTLPRGDDDLFSKDFEHAMQDFTEIEDQAN